MGWRWLGLALLAALLPVQAQIQVGEGSPNSVILGLFLQAYLRGDFTARAALPPTNRVHREGAGYVQDFAALDTFTNFTFALAKPDSRETAYQMCCQILTLHNQIGGFTGKIGYPVTDPAPGVSVVGGALSVQQSFEGGHVLITHVGLALDGRAFFIRDPFVAPWRNQVSLGLPISQERDTASRFNTNATQQDFEGGVIALITTGPRKDQIYTVSGPIYIKYFELGGINSILGYPISDEFTASGRQRQNFESGYIDYAPGSAPAAEIHPQVLSVSMDAAPVTLRIGDVIERTAAAFDILGSPVTDRPFTWTTSNRQVVQIEATGATARLRAVGAGFANVSAIVDGVSSGALRITVPSTCCAVGEGAPNASIRQALQEALSRNSITPRLPTDNSVRRMGAGYVQEFLASAPAGLGRVLAAKADSSGVAYVVAGPRLARYLGLGGTAGPLGFPTSDANAAGRQLFENNFALAGSPPALVAAPLTQKWAALGYDSGAAGSPRAEAAAAGPSPTGATGVSQTFTNGVLYGVTSGPRSGQAFLAGGPILARYLRLNGPAGILGMPISDALASEGRTRQNFELGSIDFAAGDAEGQERRAARAPAVSVLPGQATIGGRVRISISGFAPGRRLLVSVGATPEFEVTPAAGAFGWDQQLRPGVAPGAVRVLVRDPEGNESAETSYRVRAPDDVRHQLLKVSGDNQTGVPGSELPLPLVVRLLDDGGNPIAGGTIAGGRVLFGSIGGSTAAPGQAVTDAGGYAQARLRLGTSTGLVLATAESNGRVLTFSARSENSSLTTFPAFQQGIDNINLGSGSSTIHQKGSLLTALAALFRYYQDRGDLPPPNGLAGPAALNQFLLADGYLPFTLGGRPELVVNLPRALSFVGDAADFEALPAEPEAIRDSLNLRRPVLLGLMLRSGDQDRGGHYVVAIGVAADGAILIHDPSPDFNRSSLNEYSAGFRALDRNWSGRALHALRLRLDPRPARGLLIHGPGSAALSLSAPTVWRSYQVRIPALAAYNDPVLDSGETAQLLYVDGAAPQYQLSVRDAAVTVRGQPAPPGVYRIVPDPFAVTPETLSASVAGLRNAAGFGSRVAPGALASLFGSGLDGLRANFGGRTAPILFAQGFQANLQVPYDLAPGAHLVDLASTYGSTRLEVSLDEAAPGIFALPGGAGAVLNQDGTLNAVLNPARRGSVLQVFVTGLGAVAPSVDTGAAAPASPLSRAVAPLTAALDGRAAQVLFAGLAPGFIGLGQVNVLIPAALAPNAAAQLVMRAAGLDSNAVPVAIQ